MKDSKLYTYAVIYRSEAEALILIPPTPIMARDESEVKIVASRQIPEDMMEKLNEVDILVRPF